MEPQVHHRRPGVAGTLVTTIPIAIVFFTFQRYFVQGVAATGVKG